MSHSSNLPPADDGRDITSQDDAVEATWEDCPAGMIGAMIDEQRALHRRAAVGRVVKVGIVAAIAVPAGVLIGQRMFAGKRRRPVQSSYQHPINCTECLELMALYQAKELDSKLMTLVDMHLEACRPCADKYAQTA